MRLARLLLPLLAIAAPALADAPRAEVPIRAVVLPDGVRRYTVTVTIDGTAVEAGLDTGSTGLRVLKSGLSGAAAAASGETVRYGYGSGVRFEGARVRVALALPGVAAATVPIQRIDTVGCLPKRPDCPAARIDPARYRIMGDGAAGQGFAAILGIGLHSDTVPNPFAALGIHRWIVDLPRGPGETGRLILNPAADDIARYRQFAVLGDSNQVAGCLVRLDDNTRICAPAMIDSGASGLRVQGGKADAIWPSGTRAAIVVGDSAVSASFPVVIGRRDQASGMFAAPPRANGGLSLSLGLAPYLHWSVLYDADTRRIGLADR